jgi:hypothetical protein
VRPAARERVAGGVGERRLGGEEEVAIGGEGRRNGAELEREEQAEEEGGHGVVVGGWRNWGLGKCGVWGGRRCQDWKVPWFCRLGRRAH